MLRPSALAPGPRSRPRRRLHGRAALAARALALGAGYASLSTVVTVVTSFGTEAGAAFWPGAGLSVAALLLRPRREWPALLAAVFAAELAVDLATGFHPVAALGFGVANCAEPLLAAVLLQRWGLAPPDLARVPHLLRFVAAAVVAGPALGGLLGTAIPALALGDPWLPRLPRWIVGDGMGVLMVAPIVLSWPGRSWGRRHLVPLAVLAGAAVVTAGPWREAERLGLAYLLIPALVLVALRLRTPGAAAGVVLVAAVVETVSAASAGPFAEGGRGAGLLAGQMFLLMCAFTALTVAALTDDLVRRERAEVDLRAQALYDSLTGLANRRLVHERLRHALDRLRRHPSVVVVACIDLDGFKAVNDRHGHAAGDAVLVETARRIQRTVRETDTAARLGGDEFVVVAEDIRDADEAGALVARLTAELNRPVRWQGRSLEVGASVGLAVTASASSDPDQLVAMADRAMYRAKRRQRRYPVVAPDEVDVDVDVSLG
ncbi:MAG TPA: diguanylate cyclase [Acidimicrobiales bacterium]|nr:diguanylate cyclase [Acidimicrobiales bacterium]